MSTEQIVEILLRDFPEWNDQIELDEYDAKAIVLILKKAGVIK